MNDLLASMRDPSIVPRDHIRHVGIIPDGTRRWARERGLSLDSGYAHAMRRMGEHVRAIYERGATAVSLYLCSTYNFRRSPDEVRSFCEAEARFCTGFLTSLSEELDIAVVHAGNAAMLDASLREAIAGLTIGTKDRLARRMYLCAAYDPIEELSAAAARSAGGDLLPHLWVPEPLDLVIRTAGSSLLSNFLPLQARYARLAFLDAYFNDVEARQITDVIDACTSTEWRFGS
jgi:undecaprenyl pyrophosphate synthase